MSVSYRTVMSTLFVSILVIGSGVIVATMGSQGETVGSDLVIGHVSTAGQHFGWGDMGTYLYRATVYQESLVGMDSNGNYTPRLADSWETNDSQTWTFHLNQDAKWHDGVPFTASDVWFTINYTIAKEPWGMNDAKFMEQIESVSMPDDYTIVITMDEPYANLLNNIRIGLIVIPEHIYQYVDDPMTYGVVGSDGTGGEINATIGTGPYKVVSLDTTARLLKFTVNEDYYRGTPSVTNITVRFYSNEDSMVLALLNGDIDTTFGWGSGVSFYNVPSIIADSDLDIELNSGFAVHALGFNCDKEPFNNSELRQAISYAIDYESLRKIILGGYGETANAGIIHPDMQYYVETAALVMNTTEAERMLDELGFVDSDSDGWRDYPNGTSFEPQFLTTATGWRAQASEIIANNLRDVGINVDVKVISSGWASEKNKREYDMILTGTSQAGTFAWEGYFTIVVDGNASLADCQVFDSEFQDIIVQLRSAVTEEDRQAAAEAVQEYYAENCPAIPLYWQQLIQPYNNKYSGFGFDPGFGTVMCYDTYFNLTIVE